MSKIQVTLYTLFIFVAGVGTGIYIDTSKQAKTEEVKPTYAVDTCKQIHQFNHCIRSFNDTKDSEAVKTCALLSRNASMKPIDKIKEGCMSPNM